MKEIVGLPRSHVVEEFVDKVGEKMKEKGEYIVEIPKVELPSTYPQIRAAYM